MRFSNSKSAAAYIKRANLEQRPHRDPQSPEMERIVFPEDREGRGAVHEEYEGEKQPGGQDGSHAIGYPTLLTHDNDTNTCTL